MNLRRNIIYHFAGIHRVCSQSNKSVVFFNNRDIASFEIHRVYVPEKAINQLYLLTIGILQIS